MKIVMLVLTSTKKDAIHQLASYSAILSKKLVRKSIYKKILDIYTVLKNKTTNSARYIEVKESEIDNNLLDEYIHSFSIVRKNIIACIYFGGQVSPYAKQKIEEVMKDAIAVYALPITNLSTDKIIIYLSFLKDSEREFYDVDFAINMLEYDD